MREKPLLINILHFNWSIPERAATLHAVTVTHRWSKD